MSSLLPLIVLSIALSHCTLAIDPPNVCDDGWEAKSHKGAIVYHDVVETIPACNSGKCYLKLSRSEDVQDYTVRKGCILNEDTSYYDEHQTRIRFEDDVTKVVEFICDAVVGRPCNTEEEMLNSYGNDAQKHRVSKAKAIGLIANSAYQGDGKFKTSIEWDSGFVPSCITWDIQWKNNGAVETISESSPKTVQTCLRNRCFAYFESEENSYRAFVGCNRSYTSHEYPIAPLPTHSVELFEDAKKSSMLLYCTTVPNGPCNSFEQLFDFDGDAGQKERAATLLDALQLKAESFVDGTGERRIAFNSVWVNRTTTSTVATTVPATTVIVPEPTTAGTKGDNGPVTKQPKSVAFGLPIFSAALLWMLRLV